MTPYSKIVTLLKVDISVSEILYCLICVIITLDMLHVENPKNQIQKPKVTAQLR